MPIRVDAYTAGGITTGVVARAGPLRSALDGGADGGLAIEQATWLPLDGSGEREAGNVRLAADDLFLLVSDEPDSAPVHAAWHTVELDAGPYHVRGEMPTMPGFDPGRALARPSGEFVLLRDAHISLSGRTEAGETTAARLLVNRYTVDRIEADLMLGFFFPGAEMTVNGSVGLDAPITINAQG
jgi:hypothetical protein